MSCPIPSKLLSSASFESRILRLILSVKSLRRKIMAGQIPAADDKPTLGHSFPGRNPWMHCASDSIKTSDGMAMNCKWIAFSSPNSRHDTAIREQLAAAMLDNWITGPPRVVKGVQKWKNSLNWMLLLRIRVEGCRTGTPVPPYSWVLPNRTRTPMPPYSWVLPNRTRTPHVTLQLSATKQN